MTPEERDQWISIEWLLLVVAINCCMPSDRYSLFGAGWIAVYIISIDRK